MTKKIVPLAQPLGISAHNHLIVGRDGHVLSE
jgi:DNA repair protein RadC